MLNLHIFVNVTHLKVFNAEPKLLEINMVRLKRVNSAVELPENVLVFETKEHSLMSCNTRNHWKLEVRKQWTLTKTKRFQHLLLVLKRQHKNTLRKQKQTAKAFLSLPFSFTSL